MPIGGVHGERGTSLSDSGKFAAAKRAPTLALAPAPFAPAP
jgi:hypothetical protein